MNAGGPINSLTVAGHPTCVLCCPCKLASNGTPDLLSPGRSGAPFPQRAQSRAVQTKGGQHVYVPLPEVENDRRHLFDQTERFSTLAPTAGRPAHKLRSASVLIAGSFSLKPREPALNQFIFDLSNDSAKRLPTDRRVVVTFHARNNGMEKTAWLRNGTTTKVAEYGK